MRYSAKTGGFYPKSIFYPSLPDDLVDVDINDYHNLLNSAADGLEIVADTNGYPMLATPAPPSIEQLRAGMILSSAQARLRLAKAGMLLNIIERINAMSDDEPLKIMWEYSTEYHRLNPLLIDFCTKTLNMNDEKIDELFI